MSLRSQALLAVMATVFAASALAQAAPVRIRGVIDGSDATSLSVTTRDGRKLQLALTAATRYSAVKALELSAIQTDSFIGIAGKPAVDGKIEALEVVVFPADARGAEGHFDWDLLPGSSMTNATVSALVASSAGRDLVLTYQGKDVKVMVPKNVPIVTFTPSSSQEMQPGLAVFVVASRADDGQFTAGRVVLEKDGVKPPM